MLSLLEPLYNGDVDSVKFDQLTASYNTGLVNRKDGLRSRTLESIKEQVRLMHKASNNVLAYPGGTGGGNLFYNLTKEQRKDWFDSKQTYGVSTWFTHEVYKTYTSMRDAHAKNTKAPEVRDMIECSPCSNMHDVKACFMLSTGVLFQGVSTSPCSNGMKCCVNHASGMLLL